LSNLSPPGVQLCHGWTDDPAACRTPTVSLYTSVFDADPVITYLLSSLPKERRLAYLPAFFNTLLKAVASNKAVFNEANNYESAAVLMPPGERVDNVWTMVSAGFVGCLWNLGLGGCKVSPEPSFFAQGRRSSGRAMAFSGHWPIY